MTTPPPPAAAVPATAATPVAPSRFAGLLARNASAMQHSMARPLIVGMADGSVTGEAFQTYLGIEFSFVQTAARLLGFCIWHEHDWEVAVRHAASLAGLVGEQTAYFEAAAERTGISGEELKDGPGSGPLDRIVGKAASHGGYPAVLICLAAAETLYGTWCTQAVQSAGGSVPGLASDWIDLHTTPEFTAQVAFLQGLVDRIDPAELSDAELDRWFVRMLEAEDAFHDSALPTSADFAAPAVAPATPASAEGPAA